MTFDCSCLLKLLKFTCLWLNDLLQFKVSEGTEDLTLFIKHSWASNIQTWLQIKFRLFVKDNSWNIPEKGQKKNICFKVIKNGFV